MNPEPIKEKFTNIYVNKSFGDSNSVSGPGSDERQTSVIIKEIPLVINKYRVKSILEG